MGAITVLLLILRTLLFHIQVSLLFSPFIKSFQSCFLDKIDESMPNPTVLAWSRIHIARFQDVDGTSNHCSHHRNHSTIQKSPLIWHGYRKTWQRLISPHYQLQWIRLQIQPNSDIETRQARNWPKHFSVHHTRPFRTILHGNKVDRHKEYSTWLLLVEQLIAIHQVFRTTVVHTIWNISIGIWLGRYYLQHRL